VPVTCRHSTSASTASGRNDILSPMRWAGDHAFALPAASRNSVTSSENHLWCPLMMTVPDPAGSGWAEGIPCARRASAQSSQFPPSTGSFLEAQRRVPHALSSRPCCSIQLAPRSSKKRVSAASPRNTAWFKAEASQSPPRVAIGQPSSTMSLTASSQPSAASSGSRRSSFSGKAPGRSGRSD